MGVARAAGAMARMRSRSKAATLMWAVWARRRVERRVAEVAARKLRRVRCMEGAQGEHIAVIAGEGRGVTAGFL
jgi:hypothetical protein